MRVACVDDFYRKHTYMYVLCFKNFKFLKRETATLSDDYILIMLLLQRVCYLLSVCTPWAGCFERTCMYVHTVYVCMHVHKYLKIFQFFYDSGIYQVHAFVFLNVLE